MRIAPGFELPHSRTNVRGTESSKLGYQSADIAIEKSLDNSCIRHIVGRL